VYARERASYEIKGAQPLITPHNNMTSTPILSSNDPSLQIAIFLSTSISIFVLFVFDSVQCRMPDSKSIYNRGFLASTAENEKKNNASAPPTITPAARAGRFYSALITSSSSNFKLSSFTFYSPRSRQP
jgi:hypothetical protein